jgi:uncharacterized oxidoreductase
MPVVAAELLRPFATDVIAAAGTPPDLAGIVGESLVAANLAGHDSHGVLRLNGYCTSVKTGDVRPAERPRLIGRRLATARIDGGWGWGQPAMLMATDAAIDCAREFGMGAAVVHGCYHIGRAAPYVEQVARAGMVGIIMSNAGPAVAPFGGRQRVLGTNPIAWAMPRGAGRPPLCFDIATAGIAEGKLRVAMSKDLPIAPGLLVTADGLPTENPHDFYAGGAILPFGGHKGNGFSILAQMLGRGLAGMDTTGFDGPRGANGPIIIVLNIELFTDLDTFTDEIDAQCDLITRSAPAEGVDAVLLPGDIELATERERSRDGIPLPESTWAALAGLAGELRVPMPEPAMRAG